MLASGDDDGYIYLWKQKIEEPGEREQRQLESTNAFLNDDGFEDLETWQHFKVLRGHIEDICDLTWSKDSQLLLSGSVDNSAILWDTTKGTKLWCSDLIKGYVQGVAIDPHVQFMAALSTDRTLRIYNLPDKRLVNATRRMNIKGNKYKAFFCDDTVQTFCRRLEFSPDGQFLIAPTSRLAEREDAQQQEEKSHEENGEMDKQPQLQTKIPLAKPSNVFLIFRRERLNRPMVYYETGREVALCARFCPIVFKLRESGENFWDVPYRIVFAVATTRSILIYDSQQAMPIAYISQIHLARLTDISWSNDGRLLMISSYDGYTSLVAFDKGEIGEPYEGAIFEPMQPKEEVTPPAPAPPVPSPPAKKVPDCLTIRRFLIKRS